MINIHVEHHHFGYIIKYGKKINWEKFINNPISWSLKIIILVLETLIFGVHNNKCKNNGLRNNSSKIMS
jgi:hypothetical protein